MPTNYLKRRVREGIYSYYKVLSERYPPACERLIFMGPTPIIDFTEYELNSADSLIKYLVTQDYLSIQKHGEPITLAEYKAAYQRATAAEFSLYINGDRQ